MWTYVAGVMTLPVLFAFAVFVAWLVQRNLEVCCRQCGLIFGSLDSPRTFDRVTHARYKIHLWTGQCRRRGEREAL